MNGRAHRSIVVILAVITLTACGGGAGKDIPALQLQVEPVPGVYIQYDSLASIFRIGNELIERRISVDTETHRIFTAAFINKLSDRNYIRSLSEEFSLRANSTKLSGVTGDFEYVDHEIFGSGGVKGLTITLRAQREEVGALRVKLVYEIYLHMPVTRKWIEIANPGGSSVTIDSIQVESLSLLPGSEYDLEVYAGSRPRETVQRRTVLEEHDILGLLSCESSKSPFEKGGFRGIWGFERGGNPFRGIFETDLLLEIPPNPPLLKGGTELPALERGTESVEVLSPVVFDAHLAEGFFIGNESPGVLKYSDLYSDGSFISIGMKPYYRNYATEIQLAPNEEFISPAAFILFFKGEPDQAQEVLAEFVSEYLARSRTPRYSGWYENIAPDMTEPEARERAQLAAKSGADIFCLSGGWASKRGDWTIDENAHLEDFGRYAHDLGMKFGLCVDLAVADLGSQIIAEYPQWVVKSKDGSDYTIPDGDGGKMMCLGSEYTVYMTHGIDALVKELGLDYIKLTGPMIPDGETSGCFAQDHIHRSSAESLWYIYEGLSSVCRYLHSQHPDLIIDVSPESYNPEGTIDYALLKYADVEWPF